MEAVGIILMGLSGITSIVSIICWVMVLIKMFGDEANGGVGKGIFGVICGLYAFIWGWQNVNTHDNKPVMLGWTAAFIGGILLNIISSVVMSSM
jgi:hypothetical protein